jgi:hypothetical protein
VGSSRRAHMSAACRRLSQRPPSDSPINQLMRKAMSRQSDNDNHANQCNPNNDEYWHSRGEDERPDNWEERRAQDDDDED